MPRKLTAMAVAMGLMAAQAASAAEQSRGGWAELLAEAAESQDEPRAAGEPRSPAGAGRSDASVETLRREFVDRLVGNNHGERLTDLVGRISRIAGSRAKSDREKMEEMRVLQRNTPEELFTSAVRFVPVYADGRLQTFDTYMREQAGGRGDVDFTADPVGAGMSMLFNPTTDNIADRIGADDRVRDAVKALGVNPFDR